jgi:beta-lactamase class A
VSMSIRDLVVAMLTISDNVATDALIATVGLDEINRTTARLGIARTRITSDMRDMLDAMAADAGFRSYAELVVHDPDVAGPPSLREVTVRLAAGAVLDPSRGNRTTAAETVTLLQAIWTDRAGPAQACAAVRQAMGRQLTRDRIASGFGPDVAVSAKSGGLMGIVRNEAGVVAFPDGSAYAVAVFTRREPCITTEPGDIHAGIGRVARALVDELRDTRT